MDTGDPFKFPKDQYHVVFLILTTILFPNSFKFLSQHTHQIVHLMHMKLKNYPKYKN